MSVVLLTGGTGFVGRNLRSAAEDWVVLLGRKRPNLSPKERWSHVDLSRPVAPEKLAGGEALCHLAYSMPAGPKNVAYNRHLIDAVNGCPDVKRVILMSSVSVYGENGLSVVDEESPCNPIGGYAETKLACEAAWREKLREDCELTVLRPTEIVGSGGRGLRVAIRDALERPVVGTLKRSLLHRRSLHYVAVSNVVAAVLFCLRRRQACAREVFIVSEDHEPENESYAVMQDFIRKLCGKRPLPGPPVPRPLTELIAKITGRPLAQKQVFDSRKIRAAGFHGSMPLGEEVRHLVWSG